MSHFSAIKTKLRNKPQLQEALEILQYDVKQDQELKVTGNHGIGHETVEAELSIGTDVGFRMNPMTGEYELVADLMFWDQTYSVDKFLNQIHQRYAFNLITKVSEEQSLQFVETENLEDGSIRLLLRKFK